MDTFISSALEEICCRGSTGVALSSLWATLTPTPGDSLKASLWSNLLSIPSLQFIINDRPFSADDPKIQSFEDAEKLNLKIVANEHLRDCFVGLYDFPSSSIGSFQRRALERLAVARTNGITQNQLAKEFGIEGNNFFYRVKNLESRKLIVRQPVVVKTKEAVGDGETKNSSIVNTNLIYLPRYAKHLGVQQRFEINKEERNSGSVEEIVVGVDGSERDSSKDDLLIKDFLPAMKAICDKLEAASDKVLVVSDIKKSLGYTKNTGHRAWRNICRRLKDACIVEEFDAKVNDKVERCLRLLKKFQSKNFETKTILCGQDHDKEQLVKFGRRYQKTDQLVELDIDHQIYDAIDAKKSEGATLIEVCERLGIDRKRNDSRFQNLFSRFGMHVQAENHKKTVAFRVWTSENSNPDESNAFLVKSQTDVDGKNKSTINVDDRNVPSGSTELLLEHNHSTSEVDLATSRNLSERETDSKLCCGSPEEDQSNHLLNSPAKVAEVPQEPMDVASNAKLDSVSMGMEMNIASSKTTLLKLPESGLQQMLPYLPLTVDGASREQRILERLQNEKYILRVELHRWLVSFEKDKRTAMDRRTIERILNKLQQQGQCKVVEVKLPAVTNCTNNRHAVVVLHPSVQSFPPELMDEINDRLRSFEKQIRVEASSKLKPSESVPVLNSVMRTEIRVSSNEQAVKAETMRANGFVLAKMIRARLLHNFLWGHLSSFPGWNDVLLTGLCEHSYKFLALETAIKSVPIELFLKVIGIGKKNDNIIEKSKRGLCLSDLPVEEYKELMDTRATGRLSMIVDILRRLKLIRLIRKGHSEDGVKAPHASFVHAMELRPYIEEPSSVIAASNLRPRDLRPRIRHDFILLNREAVDEYWNTLEYCYAAADPRAALHAFPGSAVPEVFQPRLWTSVQIMSAHQRAEIQKLTMKGEFNKKISFEECVKIARDLNLSLQQVLCAYYRKHKQRFNIFEGVVNANEDHQEPERRHRASTKRKRSSELSSVKSGRREAVNEQLDEQGLTRLPDTIDQFMEDHGCFPSEQQADCLSSYHDTDHLESVEEIGISQDEKCNSETSQCTSSKALPVHKRFFWTDENDRQLLIQYTRQLAVLGPKGRMDWSKIPDLQAPPKACVRRISVLKKNINFRNTLNKFCNLLHERYTKHLEKTQRASFNENGCRVFLRSLTSTNMNKISNVEDDGKADFEEKQWDDFSDRSLKKAFENLLLFKQMAKMQASQGVATASEELSNLNTNINSLDSEFVSSSTPNENIHKQEQGMRKDSQQRSRRYRFYQKFMKCLKEGTFVNTQVHKSLAVSNAVELLKLVFLSTSAASELHYLAETLRRYSEHDLFGAFTFLREKKILIGGDGDQPFLLSQLFLQSVSKSFFPSNTGKRAAKFSSWIHEREKDLMEGGVDLAEELQCGDIFQLFALVSSGELSISTCLPDEGVGEVEDLRSSKRKAEDDDELCDNDRSKKMKSLADGELISRREKGFPGITVLMHRARISMVNTVELLNNGGLCIGEDEQNDKFSYLPSQKIVSSSSQCDCVPEILNLDSVNPTMKWSSDSPWEAMVGYAQYLMSELSDSGNATPCSPEILRTVYVAVQKSGDQGLSLEEVSRTVGGNVHELVFDVLQAFGHVLKVNAYDAVRFVDALYHSKYFLTAPMGSHQALDPLSVTRPLERSKDGHLVSHSESHDVFGYNSLRKATMADDHVHKVTILNLPEDVVSETQTECSNAHESCLQEEKAVSPERDHDREFSSNYLHVPILPWINGDGSINKVVYNGLVRRILGIVMRNPGILEESVIHQIDVLNPQSCRTLLELMILDKHIIVRKMHQSKSSGPPALLGTLFGSSFKESKSVYQNHLFANPMSASFL